MPLMYEQATRTFVLAILHLHVTSVIQKLASSRLDIFLYSIFRGKTVMYPQGEARTSGN